MSTAEETISTQPAAERKSVPVLNRVLDFISSVRFGVFQLVMLVILAMIGMLVLQQNVQGFDAYYVSLTPAERLVFGYLGFFDIYHSWYFLLLLLSLSLNIVLASIDHFPSSWSYIRSPKLTATKNWLKTQKVSETIDAGHSNEKETAEQIRKVFEKHGLGVTVSEASNIEYGLDSDGRKDFSVVNEKTSTIVFGQSGQINRIGAYIVHVFLLTLFLGHFVSLTTGMDADVRMTPGQITDQIQMIQFDLDKKEKFNVQIPFSIECTDIQQTLINPKGGIDVSNTLDWRTQMKIVDPAYGAFLADVSMNSPVNYRGYRFFQAQTIPMGSARTITLELTPDGGGQPFRVTLGRDAATDLPDGTNVEFAQFQPDFIMGADGEPSTRSGDYNNSAAILSVTPPQGERTRVYAMRPEFADRIPLGSPKLGYKWRLVDFEKSPMAHVLSIKYDPFNAAFVAWYIGGFGLIGALAFVFFISHKRVWARVETNTDGKTEIVLAGDVNRSEIPFKDKFQKLADDVKAIK